MQKNLYTHSDHFPCTAQELYDWHSRDGALERLLPPWEKAEVVCRRGGIDEGAQVTMRLKAALGPCVLPFSLPFTARHLQAVPGKSFHDIQLRGPFAHWSHQHLFTDEENGCRLDDRVEWQLPGGIFATPFHPFVERRLARMFRHRSATLKADLALHHRCSQLTDRPLRVLVSGASGVLGSTLCPLLTTGGHSVWRLVRDNSRPRAKYEVRWDPATGELDRAALDALPRFDAVVHLAGEYIGLHRWSREKRRRVIASRRDGTRLLVDYLRKCDRKPSVFLSASASGWYGDSGPDPVTEEAPCGSGFISEVCRVWEEEATRAEEAGIRTVLLRFGVGLTPRGGALARILGTTLPGCPRSLGGGDQIISWISIDDMAAASVHAMTCKELRGALNIAAPSPVSNREFMRRLAAVTGKPLLPALPAGLLRRIYGSLADEMILAGCRMDCRRLEASGFTFRHPDLTVALPALLGRWH